jgi:hypothetical protein
MQIRVTVVVSCPRVTPPASPQNGESPAPRVAAARCGRCAGSRPHDEPRRAARLHQDPGREGARRQHVDLQSACAAVHRDGGDGLVHAPCPGRRARALRGGATARGSTNKAPAAGAPWPQAGSTARGSYTHPRSARRRQEPQRDRTPAQCRRCADVAGRPPVVAFDGARRSRPPESAQLRRSRLERDELANGSFARAGLEAHHESNLESLRETLECGDARTVLTRLGARNGGVTRPHPPGELLLGEPELGSPHDHESRDPLIGRQPISRTPVLGIAASPTLGLRHWPSDRAARPLGHDSTTYQYW